MNGHPGQLIGGKYELERVLGTGAMGEVWLARHTTLDDRYAVKLIDLNAVPDAGVRFQREAHIASKLSKKTRHIVSVTDHGEQGHLAYLVMQLLEGESLDECIQNRAPLPLGDVAVIVTQVARALEHAHAEGFVHRDLKPANIFLTRDEEGRLVVKLLDFGIARDITGDPKRSPFATAKDTIVGTPSYMSPEQTRGLDSLDRRCDLWALAVVAYEALTRELPFEGETLQDVLISIGIGRDIPILTRRPDLPPGIVAFFARAYAGDIGERFSSASELARDFARAALGGLSEPPSMAAPLSELPGAMHVLAMPSRIPPPPRMPVIEKAPADPTVVMPLPMRRAVPRAAWLVGLVLAVIVLLGVRAAVAPHARSREAPSNGAPPPPVVTTRGHAPVSPAPLGAPARSEPVSSPPSITAEPSANVRRPSLRAPAVDEPPRAGATRAPEPAAPSAAAPVASELPATPPLRQPAPARSADRSEVF